MHNAAFNAARLPHVYTVQELPLKGGLDDVKSEAATQLRTRLSAPDFGGASVTIPHKQAIVPFLDELTPAARAIGAVNTIVPVPMPDDPQMRHKLLGDNTDWLGLSITLARALAKREVNGVPQRRRRALVVGGGGTARAACYALTAGAMKPGPLGAPFVLYVHARDPAQAKDLAKAFGGHVITDLDAFALTIQDDFFDAVVSTVPGGAKFTLPRKLLACKPAVMDAAYKPAETALLQQARVSGCSVAQGATMLVEQGVSQFERWTRRRAPTDCMRTAVFEGVPNLEDPQADKACAPSPAPAELVVL
ncbi:hypothetical protein M885DRAFT_431462 [Pelagophyceae sp. CCMP2097]|nr:hypothetical protein M885DRAFT_431462 [Pelagophyceae sp. CCMP2097]